MTRTRTMHPDESHRVRHHVQLPSGKRIEVVYLDNPLPPSLGEGPSLSEERLGEGPSLSEERLGEGSSLSEERSGEGPSLGKERLGEERRQSDPTTEPLHICFYCSGELVHPLDWAEAGPGRWRILLRCPECEATREGVFEQAAVERLDDELDRAAEALLSDLQRVTHANMAEEIDLFTRALDADLIQPCDF